MKTLFIFLLLVSILFSLEINDKNIDISNFQVKYLEDNASQYTLDTILNQDFSKTISNKHSFGNIKDSTIWVKVELSIQSDIKKLYLQHLDTVSVTDIHLYFLEGKKLLKSVTSGVQNSETKAFDALLKVDVQKGKTYTFLAKYSTKNSLILNLNIYDEQNYYDSKKDLHILFALFLGVMGALLIYNIYLYFALRYIQYLYFFMMVFGLTIFNMAQVGIFIEFFPLSIHFYEYLYYAIFIKMMFFYLFTQKILNTKQTMPYVHIYFTFSIISIVVTFLYTLVTSSIYEYLQMLYYIFIYGSILGLSILLWAMYKRVPFIYHYSIATAPSVVMAMVWASLFLGYIEYSYIPRYGSLYGSMYEMMTYSILVSYYIKTIQKENELQKSIMHQQEKQASLGELLVYITHQWRAPLATLSSLVTLNEAKLKNGIEISKEQLEVSIVKSNQAIKFMADTMDNFSSFYSPSKFKTDFTILSAIESIQQIIDKDLLSFKIDLSITGDESISIYGVSNDISQIILAFISNAKHIFNERKIQNPAIAIHFYKRNNNVILEVSDNAGGIEVKPIEAIFEPFVSERVGTQSGIGLYMVKSILDASGSNISVKNENGGAKFTVVLKEGQ
ncbi:sensor histidine kinase [Sulfurimonas sp. SAG-AH-194-C21]|nr:sensor histidine kinase [Sulfurimonas sp. SAG-AH-194-C21]MDF1882566.1 sensor histidine kinase [Sulfurimonas sp. SAG-AH-194-C21]